MSLLIREKIERGYNQLISPDKERLEFIDFGLLKLSARDSHSGKTKDREVALVVLSGKCSIITDEKVFEGLGGREDVFSGKPHTLYLPPGKSYQVNALDDLEVAVCGVLSKKRTQAKLIRPENVTSKSRGKLNWRRDIRDIITPEFEAGHMLLGETVNPPGNWSSVPPHRHDFYNPPEETDMEEVYFFKTKPEGGFGVQRIYNNDGSVDETTTVRENDVVIIPQGYHPVAAAPGYKLYYLWVLAGKQRLLIPRDDPQHSWLKKTEAILEEQGF